MEVHRHLAEGRCGIMVAIMAAKEWARMVGHLVEWGTGGCEEVDGSEVGKVGWGN